MATDIDRLKGIRAAYKGHCTRNKNVADDVMNSPNPDIEELENILEALSLGMEKITAIDQQILDSIQADHIDREVHYTMNYEEAWFKFKNPASLFIIKARTPVTTPTPFMDGSYERNSAGTASPRNKRYVRLPKMVVKEFYGDPLEWLSFWDSFESAVHKNTDIDDVDRMNYLKSFLKGDTLRAIDGLPLNNANYAVCIDLRKKRFGQKQLVVNAYMDAVMKLPYATSDVKKLRRFYDTLEGYLRGLESLEITSKSYGCLLLPILLKKIPEELKRVILRASVDPTIEDLRDLLHKEIEVREKAMCSDTKSNNEEPLKRNEINLSTTSSMLVH